MASDFSLPRGRKLVNSFRRKQALIAAVLAASLLAPALSRAANVSWDGAGTTWNTGADWSTLALPGTSDTAVFSTSDVASSQAVTLDASQSVLGLLFQNTGYTVSLATGTGTNTLTLGAGGITDNSGAGAVTISSLLALGGTETWTNNSSSLLTLGGNITIGGNTLTVAGTGNTSISGVLGVAAGSGGLTMTGTGTLTLTGADLYTGNTTLKAGTLSLDFSAAGAPTSGIINNGATSVATANSVLVLGGGALSVKGSGGTNTQYFKSTTINAGGSAITLNNNGGNTLVALGAITRSTGGTVVLNLANAGTASATNGVTTTTTNANSILGPWAIVSNSGVAANDSGNGFTYATNNGTDIVAFTTATSETTAGTWGGISGTNPTVNYDISNAGTFSGAGNSRSVNTIRYTGSGFSQSGATMTINGFLNAGTGTATITSTFATGASGELVLAAASANINVGGVITGSAVTIMGPNGIVTLSGANSYTGLTTVTSGELDLNTTAGGSIPGNITVTGGTVKFLQQGTANQIVNTKNLVVSGGTFNLQGFNQTLANVQITGGTITGTTGVLTSTNAFDLESGSVSAILGGTAGATKTTAGTVTLSGASTYTGTTAVSGGTLKLAPGGSLYATTSGSTGTISVGVSGTLLVAPSSGSITVGNTTASSGAILSLATGGTFSMVDGAIGTFNLKQGSGVATGLTLNGNTLNFDLSTAGADVLAVTNGASVGGTNTINLNTLGSSLANGTYNLITAASGLTGTFEFSDGTQSHNIIVGGVAYKLTLGNATGAETVTVAPAGNTVQWAGGIDGTWVTGGNWTGGTAPGAPSGTVYDTALFNQASANTTITVDSGRIIKYVTFDTANCPAYIIGHGGANTDTLALSTGGAISVAATVTTAQTINAQLVLEPASATTAGAYTMTNDSSTSGTLSIAGSISGGATSAGIVLTLGGATASESTIGGAISDGAAVGKLALFKSGSNTWSLTNAGNNYTGGTTIAGGVLSIVNGSLGTGPVRFTGGTLQFANPADISGLIASSTSAIMLDTNGNNVTFGSALASTNTAGLNKIGAGTLSLSAANNYSGGTTISNGNIALLIDNGLPSGSSLTVGSAGGSGTLDLNGHNQTLGGIVAAGATANQTITGTSGTLTYVAGSSTFAGTITNGIALAVTSGTLTLSSVSSYTGPTSVSGTLVVTGSLGGTAVTVNSGGILSGAGGILNGSVEIASNGTLRPRVSGGSASTLTIQNLTVDNGGKLALTVGSSNSDIILAGTATLNGTESLAVTAGTGFGTANSPYNLISTNTLVDSAAFNITGPAGFYYTVTPNGSTLQLNVQLNTLTWTNGAATSSWNTSDANWNGPGGAAAYQNSSYVTFDDSIGAGSRNVLLSGTLTPATVTVNGSSSATSNYTFGGTGLLSGSTGITMNSPGKLTIANTGVNNYTGGVALNAGTLQINADTALGAVPAAPATNLTIGGSATLQAGASVNLNANRNIAISGAYTATFDTQANNMTIGGVISGASATGLTKVGSGTLTLSNTNTYGGPTTISAGTLTVTASGALSSGTVTFNGTSPTLKLVAPPANSITSIGAGATQWTINTNGVFTPTITSGTLNMTTQVAQEATSAYYNTPVNLAAPFTFQFTYQSTGSSDGLVFVMQNKGLNALGSAGGSVAVNYNDVAGVGIDPYTNQIDYVSNSTTTTNNPTQGGAASFALASGDPMLVTVTGSGSSSNVLGVTIKDLTTLSSYTTSYTLTATLYSLLNNSNTAWVGFTASTGAAIATQSVTNFRLNGLAGAFNVANAVIVQADSTIDISTSGGTASMGTLAIGGNTLSVTNSGGGGAGLTLGAATLSANPIFAPATGVTLTLGAVNDGGTARTITVNGAGTLALGSAATSLVAGTNFIVTGGGTLATNDATASGGLATVSLDNAATLSLGASQTVAALADYNAAPVNTSSIRLNGNALTVGESSENLSSTYSGRISDGTAPGKIVVGGAGTLTLAGASNYTGGTLLQSGTVQAGASGTILGTGTITFGTNTTNGTLDLNGNTVTVGGLAVASGAAANSQIIGNGSTGHVAVLTYAGGNTTFGGVIANTIGAGTQNTTLTVGSGQLTLTNGNNNYAGGTVVGGGTLAVANASGSATGSGQVFVTGGTLAGSGTITGSVSVSANAHLDPHIGTAATGVLSTGALTLNAASILDFNIGATSDLVQVNGALSLPGSVPLNVNALTGFTAGTYELLSFTSVSGSGSISLGTNNIPILYNVAVVALANEIDLQVTAKPSTTWTGTLNNDWAPIFANWSTGNYVEGSPVVFDDSGANTSIDLLGGTYTPTSLTFNNNSNAYSLTDGVLAGPAYLTMNGTNSLTLTGMTNTYTGGTVINSGRVVIDNAASLGAASGALTLNAGTLEVAATFASSRNISLGDPAAAIKVDATYTYTSSGLISGTGNLNATGQGTLVLGGLNTFSGQTLIQSGTVSIGSVNVVGNAQPLGENANPVVIGTSTAFATTNATLAYSGATAATAMPITLGSGGGKLSVTNAATTLTLTGAVTGGALTTGGAGTVALAGTTTYTGGTNVTGGTLSVVNATTLGAGSVILSGGSTFHFSNSTVGATLTLPTANSGYVASSSWSSGSQNPASVTGATPAAWQVGANGAGGAQPDFWLVDLGANQNVGQVTINWNSLPPTTYAFYIATASTPLSSLYNSPLGVQNPTVALGGATSPNTLNLGNFTLDSQQFTTVSPVGVGNNYALNGISGEYLVLYMTARSGSNYGEFISSVSVSLVGSISQTISSLSSADPTTKLVLDGGVTLAVNGDNSSTTFAGAISGPGMFVKVGTGTLTLSNGASTSTGGVAIQNGTIQAGADGRVLGTGPVTFGISGANGTLDLNNHNVTVSSLAVTAGAPVNSQIITNSNAATPATLTFAGGTSTFDGLIKDGAGTVALVMSTGTLTLTNANTYSGTTTLNGGTFVAANGTNGSATGSGSVTLNGGTLTSATTGGTINGPILAGSGAHTIAPGGVGTVGTLTLGSDLTLNANSTLSFDANVAASDLLAIAGKLNVAGTVPTLNLSFNSLSALGTTTLATFAGGTDLTLGTATPATLNVTGSALYGFTVLVETNDLKLVAPVTLTWTGSVNSAGTGTWDTGTTANFTGPTTFALYNRVVFDDSAALGGGVTNVTVAGTVTPNSLLVNDSTSNYTFNGAGTGVISGPSTLVKTGSGKLTIMGMTNTFTGGTQLGGGTLNIDSDAALGQAPATPATNVTFTGNATLQAGAPVVTLNPNRLITVNPGVTATIDTNSNAMSVGVINGAGSAGLTKAGSGTLTLTGASTYAGATVVSAGTLKVGGTPGPSTAVPLALASAAVNLNANTIVGSPSAVTSITNTGTAGGSFTSTTAYQGTNVAPAYSATAINGHPALVFGNPYPGSLSAIAGPGNGTALVSNNVAFTPTGALTIFIVENQPNGAFSPGGYPGEMSMVTPTGTGTDYQTAGNLSMDDTATSAGIRTVTPNNQAGATLNRPTTNGTPFIWDTTINTAAGTSAADLLTTAGVLPATATGTGSYTTPFSFTTVSLGGRMTQTGGVWTASGYWAGNIGQILIFNSALTGAQVSQIETYLASQWLPSTAYLPTTTPVQIASGATLDLNGYSQQVASLSGDAGSIVNDSAAGTLGTLVLNTAAGTTFSGTVQDGAGQVALTVSGSGTQSLANANNYTGPTSVIGGTLSLDAANAISASPITVTGGNLTTSVDNAISNTAALTVAGGTATLNGANSYTGPTNVSAGSLVLNAVGSISASPITLSGGTLTESMDDAISGTASLSVNGAASTATLSNANNYTGGTTATAGTLVLAANNAIGTGTLGLNGGILSANVPLTIANTTNVTGNSTLSGNQNFTFTGAVAISSGQTLHSATTGTVDFSGAASFTNNGTLDAAAGTTTFNQQPLSGKLSIQNGATLTAGSIPSSTSLVMNGTGMLNLLDAGTLTTSIISGTGISVGASSNPITATINLGNNARLQISAITVLPRATLMFNSTSSANHLLIVTGGMAAITGGGQVDVTNNDLILQNTSEEAMRDGMNTSYSGQSWNGAGLITSLGIGTSTGIGYLTPAEYAAFHGTTTFDGYTPGANDLIAKYTYLGDVNLDGLVTAADYRLMDAGYLQGFDYDTNSMTGTAGHWINGDVNYDGVVNALDYALADASALAEGDTVLGDQMYQLHAAEFGQTYISAFNAAVPEPASLMLLGLGAAGLLLRRRK